MGEKRTLVDSGGYQPGRSVIKRGEIKLQPSSIRGLYIGRIIAPETGFFNATTTVDLYHIPQGQKTIPCRQDEMLLQVLTGEGYSIIDGVKYEWERGDTIHVKPGYWHQHWNTSNKAANMLAARSTPLLNYLKPFPAVNKGEAFTPVGDYVPDHPFGLGKQEPIMESDKEWPGRPYVRWRERTKQEDERERKEGRTIMKSRDVRWEKESSLQGGEFNAMLADRSLGFDTRTVTMGIQAIVPGGCNETHVHSEAIVYILAGTGYVLVNGERFDLEEGDCAFVHYGQWHQFCSTSGPNGPPFTQMRILTTDLDRYLFPFPWVEEGEDPTVPDFDLSYVPQLPW